MLWFPFSFGAALFWAFGQVLLKKGFDHVPPLWTNILNNVISLFIWILPILFLTGFKIARPQPVIVMVIFISSALYHFFFYSISKGQISLTGTIVAGYPLFTIILSYLFLDERLALLQYIGVALILIGDTIVALPHNHPLQEEREYSWILWGFTGAFVIGSGDFMTKFSINRIGSYSHIFWLALISNVVSGFNYLIDRKNRRVPNISTRFSHPSIVGVFITLVGSLLFLLAFDYGKVSLIAPVSSIYPAIVVLLAVKFLKEEISQRQGIGIAIAIVGLILIGIGTTGQ